MKDSTRFTRDWCVNIGRLAMALVIVIAAVAVRPAQADEDGRHARNWRAQQRQYRHGRRHPPRVIYAPAPDVYYAPPPVIYAPPPPPGGFFTFIFPFRIR